MSKMNYYSKETLVNTFKAVYELLTMESDLTMKDRASYGYDALKGLDLYWLGMDFTSEDTPEWNVITKASAVRVWAKVMGLLKRQEIDEAIDRIEAFVTLIS